MVVGPLADVRVVAGNYGPMNTITYGDEIWHDLRIGEWMGVPDPATGQPAIRNPFAQDVARLQQSHCTFLACSNSLRAQAQQAVQAGRTSLSVDELISMMTGHLVPGAVLVPNGLSEVSRLQVKGLPVIYVPRQF